MSAPESSMSLQDRLRESLEPLGGELRIDAFLSLLARERARQAAVQRAAEEAPRQAQPAAAPKPAAPAPSQAGGAELEDEVKAFLQRDEVSDAADDEVSEFMDFMGDTGFNPDTM